MIGCASHRLLPQPYCRFLPFATRQIGSSPGFNERRVDVVVDCFTLPSAGIGLCWLWLVRRLLTTYAGSFIGANRLD